MEDPNNSSQLLDLLVPLNSKEYIFGLVNQFQHDRCRIKATHVVICSPKSKDGFNFLFDFSNPPNISNKWLKQYGGQCTQENCIRVRDKTKECVERGIQELMERRVRLFSP